MPNTVKFREVVDHDLGVVAPMKDGNVLGNVVLTHAAERAQEIPQPRSDPSSMSLSRKAFRQAASPGRSPRLTEAASW